MKTLNTINIEERDLQRIVCLKPELVEENLKVLNEEYPIKGLFSTYRCDLYCLDQNENIVFVELKLIAAKDVVFQIGKYKTFSETNGRFIVAALEFEPETKKILENLGFETITLDINLVTKHLTNEKDNPLLYIRKTQKKETPPKISRPFKEDTPDEEAEKINYEFLKKVKENLDQELINGFEIEGIATDRNKYSLLLRSVKQTDDKVVIYHRRKDSEIHIIYSPDYSPQTGRKNKKRVDSTKIDKKTEFHHYILDNANIVSNTFNLPLFETKQRKKTSEPNRLEITHQAWKGLSRVYTTPSSRWLEPDFIEMVTRDLYDFIDNVNLIIPDFYSHYNKLFQES